VPEGLREALSDSGLMGCRVALFEQGWDGRPRPAEHYPEAVLASFGTHDLPTWAGWRQGRDIAARAAIGLTAPDPAAYQARAAEVAAFDAVAGTGDGSHGALARFLARTPARLVALQAEDLLGLPDQPNLPGTVDTYPNWRQRLPLGPEALGTCPAVQEAGAIMHQSGRGEAPPWNSSP
jgi:4-alpha-glucanotransferase